MFVNQLKIYACVVFEYMKLNSGISFLQLSNYAFWFQSEQILKYHLWFSMNEYQESLIQRYCFSENKKKLKGVWLHVYSSWISWDFKTIFFIAEKRLSELDETHEHLDTQDLTKKSGFLIPLKNLDRICICDEDRIFDYLKESQNTANEIFKERHLELTIKFIDNLLKAREWFFDCTSHFKYSLNIRSKANVLKSTEVDIMNDLLSIEVQFSKIVINHKLSPEEFNLIWKLLSCCRTIFSLSHIEISLSSLSECLTALSLWSACPELESIYFRFSESDIENEQEAIDSAIRSFRGKFGFIEVINITKHFS